jgi:hypothetical protein
MVQPNPYDVDNPNNPVKSTANNNTTNNNQQAPPSLGM